ncbi:MULTISPECIES: hypothetical protein [unclassified Acinetobacter]|uniref:hypothetical protein n=1 Tax=unclassified Acinetobacter TaxID=196816 RepID=UPI00124FC329|nr:MULTISPECIES: hypothetical protein [unclassified Acinetobacter]
MSNQKTAVQKRNQTLARFGVASGALAGVALMTTQANALDISKATADSTAKTDIDSSALWILGIVITIYCARRVIGFFKG